MFLYGLLWGQYFKMKTNINNKISLLNKMGKNFNKILMLLMLILISMVGINAGQLLYSQDDLINDITGDIGNIRVNVVLGNANIFTTLLSGNQTYDIYYEYNELHNDMYYVIDNGIVGSNVTLIWNFDKSQTQTRYTQIFTLNELGKYVFKIDNNIDGETLQLFMDFPDTWTGYVYEQQEIEQGLPDVINKFSNSAMDLIGINLTLWKLGFYVIIFAFVVGTLILLVWLAIKFYNWGKEHNVFKKRSNHRN